MVFKAPTKWLLKEPYLYASFPFPAIRFDAHTLLSFSGCTHALAKCPPVPWVVFLALRLVGPSKCLKQIIQMKVNRAKNPNWPETN